MPASFIYITIDTNWHVPMCANCVNRHIQLALDACRTRDPRIETPPQQPARLN